MEFYGLSANAADAIKAKQSLANYHAKSVADRIAAQRYMRSDEYAAFQGVVTITQAEANFVDLNVRAFDRLGEFFAEFVPLGIGEIPVYKVRQDFEIRVNMGHLAGGPPSVKWQTQQSGIQVTPFQYFSEEVLVPNLVSVNFDIARFHEKEKALERLAYQMRLARQQYIINTMLGQPLNTPIATSIAAYYAQGTSPYVGKTPYVLDAGVQPDSVESTNILNLTTEGGLTKNVFKAIRTQTIYQGRTPTGLFISKSGKPWEAYWNQASIVATTASNGNQNPSNAIPSSKWEEAVNMSFDENGNYMNWFGMNLWTQPLNIIPVDYFMTSSDQPAVMGWDQLSESVSEEDALTGSQRGLSKRYEARSMALAQADTQLRHFNVGKLDTQ